MICPSCKLGVAKVKETRTVGTVAWRRRICDVCEYRFTTYELSSDMILDNIGRAINASGVRQTAMRMFLELMRKIDNNVKK